MKTFTVILSAVLVFVTMLLVGTVERLVRTERPITLVHKCEGGVTIIEPQDDGSILLTGEPFWNRKFAGVGP